MLLARSHGREALECRWWRTICEALADHGRTLLCAKGRGIDLHVIDTRHMNSLLPQAHRLGHGAVIAAAATPGRAPSVHDHREGAPHADEQHREARQLACR